MTFEDFKSILHKLDLRKRPYIIFLNPKDAENLKMQMPEIEDSLVIQETEFIEKGAGVLMERKSIEPWELPFTDL